MRKEILLEVINEISEYKSPVAHIDLSGYGYTYEKYWQVTLEDGSKWKWSYAELAVAAIRHAMREHIVILSPYMNQDGNWFCNCQRVSDAAHSVNGIVVDGDTFHEVVLDAYSRIRDLEPGGIK